MSPFPTVEVNSTDILTNLTKAMDECLNGICETDKHVTMDRYKIIKAVFLGVVTTIILVSICKMVFQLFVKYSVKNDR